MSDAICAASPSSGHTSRLVSNESERVKLWSKPHSASAWSDGGDPTTTPEPSPDADASTGIGPEERTTSGAHAAMSSPTTAQTTADRTPVPRRTHTPSPEDHSSGGAGQS